MDGLEDVYFCLGLAWVEEDGRGRLLPIFGSSGVDASQRVFIPDDLIFFHFDVFDLDSGHLFVFEGFGVCTLLFFEEEFIVGAPLSFFGEDELASSQSHMFFSVD